MIDFIQAIIEFFTDFFAALAEFTGGKFAVGDIFGTIGGVVGDLENLGSETETE